MTATLRRGIRDTGSRKPLLAASTALVVLGPIAGVGRAQTLAELGDGSGLTVAVGAHGIARIAYGGDEWRFADVDPVLVRVTSLAGGRVTWRHHRGDELSKEGADIEAATGTRCRVARRGCRVPGLAGTFDLVLDYELVAPPHGPGVAIRARIEASTLAAGIAAVGYRQYLSAADAPDHVVGGFTGALDVSFDDLANGTFDLSHPYLRSGGVGDLGWIGETFLTTRTAETMLVAATRHPGRRHGLLATRDGRHDPDNVARELGCFGANALLSSPKRLGFGLVGYLPNDDRPANGGVDLDVGSGLVVAPYPQENTADPYWDVVRAYRERWVDPLLAGIDKPAERPTWMERSMHVRLYVDHGGFVDVPAVTQFVDNFFANNDQVHDLSVLLWGATDLHLGTPLPGLTQLLQQLQQIAVTRGVAIRPRLYHAPTAFWTSDPTGGSRNGEVARDPFGNAVRGLDPMGSFIFQVRTDGAAAASWFASWLGSLSALPGFAGIYFDDAFRARTFETSHYDATLPVQGRTDASVAAFIAQMHRTNTHFAGRGDQPCLTTELGIVGRSVPGNLIQGGPDIVQSVGPLFVSPTRMPRLRTFVNDVAGHHWLCGYAGDPIHQWIALRNHDDLPYFAAPVVRGLVPAHAPFPTQGRYYDFVELCTAGIVDCSDPRLRAVAAQTDYQNDAMGFLRRHADILTRWRRQPLPGTTDIAAHRIGFNGATGALAYQVETDVLPYGCFGADGRLAIALTNPTFGTRSARFTVARDRYGIVLDGNHRVTLQRLQDAAPQQLLESATGDFVFAVTLQPHEFAMILIEPACTFTRTPNTATCQGGTITGSSAAAPSGGQAVGIHVSGAPPQTSGILLFSLSPVSRPLPGSTCRLLVETQPSITLPFATDASGAADLGFSLGFSITAHVQCLTTEPVTGAMVGTDALRIECR